MTIPNASTLFRFAAVLVAVALFGCESKSSTPSAPTGAANGRITPEEGGVVGDTAGACVKVPPGAVERHAYVALAPKSAEAYVTPAVRLVGQVWSFSVDGQDHFKFAKPVRLAVPFDPSLLAEGATASLSVWQEGRWQAVPGSRMEAASRQVVAEVDHFTEYAPTQDAPGNVVDNVLRAARKRFIENEFWYGSVHLSIRGGGSTKSSRYSISRDADIKFRVRADKSELAIFAGVDEMHKKGFQMPGEGEASLEQLRNIRHWTVDRTNRDPEDETELHWSVNDSYSDSSMSRTVQGSDGGKYMGMDLVFADVVKGVYSFAVAIESGTITSTETSNGGQPKSTAKPAAVSWTRHADLPAQGNVLAGSDHSPKLDANIGDGGVWTFNFGATQSTMTWTLSPVPLEDVELVLVPTDYDNWVPKGGKDEKSIGNSIPMKAELRHRGGGAPKAQMTDIVVRFVDVSTEPGVCLNRPLKGGANSPDLKFSPRSDGTVEKDGTEVHKTGKFVSVSFGVDSFDWGAWGSVAAMATLSDGRPVWAHLEGDPSMDHVRLPKRAPDSKIADAWKKEMHVEGCADTDDEDKHEKNKAQFNSIDGDGLTAYEEYRGLFAKGEHTRDKKPGKDGLRPLSPLTKDLVVHNKMEDDVKPSDLLPSVRKGLLLFQEASGIHVVEVTKDELPTSRQVNPNLGSASAGPQFGLRVVNEVPPGGDLGETKSDPASKQLPNPDRSPRGYPKVQVNLDGHRTNYAAFAKACGAAKIEVPYALEELVETTVAHELAHGLGVRHHGEDVPVNLTFSVVDAKMTTKVYDRTGKEITARPFPLTGRIGAPNNPASGNVSCLMCYNNTYNWSFNWQGWFCEPPILPLGREFCTSRDGTGPNKPRTVSGVTVPSVFGDAIKGNCLSQMRVKDQ